MPLSPLLANNQTNNNQGNSVVACLPLFLYLRENAGVPSSLSVIRNFETSNARSVGLTPCQRKRISHMVHSVA